ncbi:MAG TPA: ATP-binding protein [Candidatus Dormibacteraeota bacterium]|nr:ATP-binding protein [Candidatus Dormibacteraeota bacterium]
MNALSDPQDDHVKRELARELHDQVVQDLTAMLIDLENFKRGPFDIQSTVLQVDSVQGSLRTMLGRLRGMLYGLRGEDPWEPDFAETLRVFAVQYTARTGVRVLIRVSRDWPDPIRRTAAQHLLRIVQEAVNNARQHGGARSVRVSLKLGEHGLGRLMIQDDGRGMPQDEPREWGMGMLGMNERALLLGGTLTVESAPARGTTLRVIFPVAVQERTEAAVPAPDPVPRVV